MTKASGTQSSSDWKATIPVVSGLEAVDFVKRDEKIALLWATGILVLLFPLFFTRHYMIAGAIVAAVAAYRSAYSFCSLFIKWTKIPVENFSIDHPCLISFSGGEGYPTDPSYFTACRLTKESPEKYCFAFPVRMDNVFGKSDASIKQLEQSKLEKVYSHPMNKRLIFANCNISTTRIIDLTFKGVAWAGLAVIGGLLVVGFFDMVV